VAERDEMRGRAGLRHEARSVEHAHARGLSV
jgi:hypothetical protein